MKLGQSQQGHHTVERKGGRYRPDVDGLRAIAVALVIVFHLYPRLAPGGFVGVDLFFVISGFVVTRSVIGSDFANSRVAMLQFWRRRVLRIVPAVLFMVLVGTAALAIFRPPFPIESYRGELRTGVSAVFGLANVYLFRVSHDYFRSDQSANPFTHTWSLGVEEQFYIAFAVLFIGILGIIGNGRKRLAVSASMMAVLGLASFAAFISVATSNPTMTYYVMPFRFWEIAAGSLIAYFDCLYPRYGSEQRAWAVTAAGLCGAVLFAIAVAIGLRAGTLIVPLGLGVAGAVILIVTGRWSRGALPRLLSTRPLVQIGLMSYSLYLWHYPVLLFWRTTVGLSGALHIVSALLVIGVASVVSYRYIERPIRYTTLPFATRVLPCMLAVIVFVAGFSGITERRPGFLYVGAAQSWANDWDPGHRHTYAQDQRVPGSTCDILAGSVPSVVPDRCYSPADSSERGRRTLLLVGDSHGYADWGMAEKGVDMNAYRFATLVHDGCGLGALRSERSESCNAYWDRLPSMLRDTVSADDTVLVAIMWIMDPGWIQRAEGVLGTIANAAAARGAEVVIQAPLPVFSRPAYLCTREWYRTNYDGCSVKRYEVEAVRASVMADLRRMTTVHKNLRIWDPVAILCPGQTCSEFLGEKPLFRDTNHLSHFGSTYLAPAFVRFVYSRRPETVERPDYRDAASTASPPITCARDSGQSCPQYAIPQSPAIAR